MFLEMGQLSEALLTQVTLERSLTTVHSEMDLQLRRNLMSTGVEWQMMSRIFCVKKKPTL